ncbi:hypothetical protein OTU49_011370 [Cherax quadricarinatus]|uniref:Uncharacterized protein n=1 Tax=Cherax quadricarinatus TaxID=27406 RepID=A0AAW0Y5A1_CHEQU
MGVPTALLALVVVAVVVIQVPPTQAQLAFGPGGFSAPTINIASVFRFLRNVFMSWWSPNTTNTANISQPATKVSQPATKVSQPATKVSQPATKVSQPATKVSQPATKVSQPATKVSQTTTQHDEEEVLVTTTVPRQEMNQLSATTTISTTNTTSTTHHNNHHQPRIVEKFDAGCVEDAEGNCVDGSQEAAPVVEDKQGASKSFLNNWKTGYIIFIIISFWLTIIIGTPYIITGETIARRDEEATILGLIDQQDVLLLLSWLLGEVSNDNSCLERIVCLTPEKSSRYITVSSMIFNIASFLRRWVPYSPHYVERLQRLNEVTEDGFLQSCQNYSCPTVPEI